MNANTGIKIEFVNNSGFDTNKVFIGFWTGTAQASTFAATNGKDGDTIKLIWDGLTPAKPNPIPPPPPSIQPKNKYFTGNWYTLDELIPSSADATPHVVITE